jgi:hypothetical protein
MDLKNEEALKGLKIKPVKKGKAIPITGRGDP